MPGGRCLCEVGVSFRAEALIFSPSEVPHGLSILYSNEEKGIHFYTLVRNTKLTASKISLHQQNLHHCFIQVLSNLLLIYPFLLRALKQYQKKFIYSLLLKNK